MSDLQTWISIDFSPFPASVFSSFIYLLWLLSASNPGSLQLGFSSFFFFFWLPIFTYNLPVSAWPLWIPIHIYSFCGAKKKALAGLAQFIYRLQKNEGSVSLLPTQGCRLNHTNSVVSSNTTGAMQHEYHTVSDIYGKLYVQSLAHDHRAKPS